MDINAMLDRTRDAFGVDRVYGTPIERHGVTVIPAARIGGGAGGGTDESEGGGGAGFGVAARPAGALVVSESGQVEWRPAVDPNRIILGAQIVAAVIAVSLFMVARTRIRAATRSSIAASAIDRAAEHFG